MKVTSQKGGAIGRNPVVDVGVLRMRWALTLTLTLVAAWLIIETVGFSHGAADAIGLAFGIGLAACGAISFLVSLRRGAQKKQFLSRGLRVAYWDALAAVVTIVGVWQIVATQVFSKSAGAWLTFANGCFLLGLAVIGLVLHELSTERVVHALEVIGTRGEQREEAHAGV